jgi:protein gp37
MANKTKIEWCDYTINPVVGCSKCSLGCNNCYAERVAARLVYNPDFRISEKYLGIVDDAGHWTGEVSSIDLHVFDRLPKKPSSIFIGSMTDMFLRMPFSDWGKYLEIMERMPQHQFLMLTKRPKQMECIIERAGCGPPNLWLGVTVCCSQEIWKIENLKRIFSHHKYVSFEPLLGPVIIPEGDLPGLSAVIVGGETGPGSRPMHPDWVRSLRNQCQAAQVPFFFKGWGEWHVMDTPMPEPYTAWVSFNGSFYYLNAGEQKSATRRLSAISEATLMTRYHYKRQRHDRLLDGKEYNERPW